MRHGLLVHLNASPTTTSHSARVKPTASPSVAIKGNCCCYFQVHASVGPGSIVRVPVVPVLALNVVDDRLNNTVFN